MSNMDRLPCARARARSSCYTDGVIENDRDIIEGERRLLNAARAVVAQGSHNPASSVRYAIFADEAPADDVAIMTVSFASREHSSSATVNALALNSFTISARADAVLKKWLPNLDSNQGPAD